MSSSRIGVGHLSVDDSYYSDDDSKVVVALPAWVFVDLLPQ
jgi:hypothetical protein